MKGRTSDKNRTAVEMSGQDRRKMEDGSACRYHLVESVYVWLGICMIGGASILTAAHICKLGAARRKSVTRRSCERV